MIYMGKSLVRADAPAMKRWDTIGETCCHNWMQLLAIGDQNDIGSSSDNMLAEQCPTDLTVI
jgi:hypothetical protein